MTPTRTGIWVVFWLLLKCTESRTTSCEFHDIQSPIHDQACVTQRYRNISVTERHHCTLACIQSNECAATVHDSRHSVCMLMSEPCMSMRLRAGYVYQAFQCLCTKWVPGSDVVSGYWIKEGSSKSYIARRFIDDDLVLGKVTDKFYAIRPTDTTVVMGGNYEILVIDAICNIIWVPYDATSGQSIPTGTLVGGFMAVTNAPLFVSKLTISAINVIGYYNPFHHKARGQFHDTRSGTRFDIMVVQPPSPTSCDHI